MPNIIYTDSIVGKDGIPINTTPGAVYVTTELSTILDRIRDGSIPCGTGQVYPVVWDNDNQPPWEAGIVGNNPWKNY